MRTWLMGFNEFLLHYKLVWSETWKIRKQLGIPVREKGENGFLPAYPELIETPVSGRSRLVAYSIVGFLVAAFILSALDQVKTVTTANGKLALNGRSRKIKPTESLITKEVIMEEGESVQKREVLLKLTTLGAGVGTLKAQSLLLQARLEQIRYRVPNRPIRLNKLPELKLPDESYFQNISEKGILRLTSLIKKQFSIRQNQEYRKELNLDEKRAEQLATLIRINRYGNVPGVEENRLDGFRSLLHEQTIAKHAVFEQENKYVEAVNELRTYKSQLEQAESEILPVREKYQLVTQSFKNEILNKLRRTADDIESLTLKLEKNGERQQASVTRTPASGKVQQLKVHTGGGIAATVETLMVIVPKDDVLEVTTLVQNKDIGFINVGRNVITEVGASPYTRYGYLVGKVGNMNLDAIGDQKLGLVFNVVVSIEENDLPTGNRHIPLSSGMAITAETKVGVWSVIGYLLNPLGESITEGLHER